MMKKLSIAVIIIISLASCEDKVKETIVGWWTIDTLYYKQYDIKSCLLTNIFIFRENEVSLAVTKNRCDGFETFDEKGQWRILRSDTIPLLMKIDKSWNQIFAGTHRIRFRKDEKHELLKMEISSDSLYVVCRKGLFPFELNEKLIDKLVRLSNEEKQGSHPAR